jgi:Flp pilus assembly protein TadG
MILKMIRSSPIRRHPNRTVGAVHAMGAAHAAGAAHARREGGVYVLLLISLCVIVAILAVTFDGGRLLEERRRVQQAADLAALAAAADLYNHYDVNQGLDPSGTALAAAQSIAQANGFACDGVTSTIAVNVPPKTGVCAGMAGHAEVILYAQITGCFTASLTESVGAGGRGVARGWRKNIGVMALDSAGTGIQNSNTGRVRVIGGALYVNSTDPSALALGTGSLSADSLEIVGGYSGSLTNVTGTVDTGAQPQTDPLVRLPAPDTSLLSQQTYTSGNATLNPGIYRNGLKVSGSATVTLQPGIYVLDGGGLNIGGLANVTGSQVMIYNTSISQPSGAVSIGGTGTVSLGPPTSGTYAGISLYQDRAITTAVKISGNGKLSVTGTVYAPTAQVQFTGTGTANVMGGWVVADTVKITGSGNIDLNQSSSRPLIPDIHLVE